MTNERLRNLIEQAHMAGKIEAGIDPSYSNARAYTNEAVKDFALGDVSEPLQRDVITWLGRYRDNLPPEAVSQLQDICNVD